MASHGYYHSRHWKELRAAALLRDGYRCTVAGCRAPARIVDHIKTRPRSEDPTPADRLDNLRSLCAHHDAQIKEHRNGQRGRGGRPVLKGVGVDGWPLSAI
jgi:5-methylcytosine-specific restriction enzyme A